MFFEDEAKISNQVGDVKWRIVYFGKLLFSAMSFNLAHPGVAPPLPRGAGSVA